MTKKIPTKKVHRQESQNYWKKAQNFFQGMGLAYTNNHWDSAALEGIHAAISAADAILIASAGYKSSSERHLDEATLIAQLPLEGAQEASRHLAKVLEVKSLVEYSGDSYSPEEAQNILKHVERFFQWAKKVLTVPQQ